MLFLDLNWSPPYYIARQLIFFYIWATYWGLILPTMHTVNSHWNQWGAEGTDWVVIFVRVHFFIPFFPHTLSLFLNSAHPFSNTHLWIFHNGKESHLSGQQKGRYASVYIVIIALFTYKPVVKPGIGKLVIYPSLHPHYVPLGIAARQSTLFSLKFNIYRWL